LNLPHLIEHGFVDLLDAEQIKAIGLKLREKQSIQLPYHHTFEPGSDRMSNESEEVDQEEYTDYEVTKPVSISKVRNIPRKDSKISLSVTPEVKIPPISVSKGGMDVILDINAYGTSQSKSGWMSKSLEKAPTLKEIFEEQSGTPKAKRSQMVVVFASLLKRTQI
jgi:hypothetical protein